MSGLRVSKWAAPILITVALAGCSSSPTATNTPTSAAATAAPTTAPTTAPSAAASGPTVDGIAFPQPEQTSVQICESAISTGSMPIYYIEEHHLDQMWGMNVSYQEFEGNGPCAQALAAGQVDVADLSGNSLAFQLTDTPTTDTYVIQNSATYILVCQSSITDAASLKGQSVAVSSFGSFSYAMALLALQSLGLTADDVTITAVGGHSARLAALEGGSVGCDSEDHNQAEPLTAQGYNVLVDLSKVQSAGYVGLALEEPNSYIDANPNTSLALVAMYALGTAQFLNDTQANAAAIWAKYSTKSTADATHDIQDLLSLGWGPSDGKCNAATYAFMKQVMTAADPRIANVDPSKACTDQFTNQLDQMGFYSAIKLPGY